MIRVLLACLLAALPAAAQEDTRAAIGKPVKDFQLKDLMSEEGKTYSLADYKGKKAVVLVWISEKCDITWRYEKRTGDLMKQFGKDTQFFAVASSANDTPVSIKKYAESKNYGMPVLDDVKSAAAGYFGATNTPTYMLIDKEGVLRYRGACDDLQAGQNFAADESTAKERYLYNAIKATLEGKEPPVTEKKGFG
jgi:peroxiredoxin Q/BCP